ncbi:MAG: hypothetical protein IPK26_27065 [Planctomycetes bacterium]|nr:hypothetical protein [Planctomycetota bacterium]
MRHFAWSGILLLSACSATPGRNDALGSPHGLWVRFLSPTAIGNDLAGMTRSAAGAANGELARSGRLPHRTGELAGRELARGGQLPAATSWVSGETERLGDATASARRLVDDLAGNPIQALATAPTVIDLDRPLLPESDDRRHRTDPRDDRPEATFWERLRRRLRL